LDREPVRQQQPWIDLDLDLAVEAAAPPLGLHTLDGLPTAEGELRTHGAADDLALVQYSSGTTVEPLSMAAEARNPTSRAGWRARV